MSEGHQYRHPPITEAVIDLQIEGNRVPGIEDLDLSTMAGFDWNGSKRERLFESEMSLATGPEPSSSATHREIGWKYTKADGSYILQSRQNGFALSRIAPYDGWPQFRDEARRLWSLYASMTSPSGFRRLAVRYINRIDIPERPVDLKRYFQTFPEVSPLLPQTLSGFFMRLLLPQEDIECLAVLNQTVVPPVLEGGMSIILDIDLLRSSDIPRKEEEAWQFFETLHDRKNLIFEACITDETRKLFE